MAQSITYRKLTRYKYQLWRPYALAISIRPDETVRTDADFVVLEHDGMLRIRAGYAWDGPSGPTWDTATFMRGSLVHDALYQLIRARLLPQSARADADKLLRELCLQDGMSSFRAWYVYKAVRMFAASAARPGEGVEPELLRAP